MELEKIIRSLAAAYLTLRHPREVAAYAQRQEDVLKVCMVYPKRVDASSMNIALIRLNLNPQWVYVKLAEGVCIPELDAAVAEVAESWS